VPVSIEDGTAIAAALDDHLPLPEWPEVPRVFCRWLAPPLMSELVWGRECGGSQIVTKVNNLLTSVSKHVWWLDRAVQTY